MNPKDSVEIDVDPKIDDESERKNLKRKNNDLDNDSKDNKKLKNSNQKNISGIDYLKQMWNDSNDLVPEVLSKEKSTISIATSNNQVIEIVEDIQENTNKKSDSSNQVEDTNNKNSNIEVIDLTDDSDVYKLSYQEIINSYDWLKLIIESDNSKRMRLNGQIFLELCADGDLDNIITFCNGYINKYSISIFKTRLICYSSSRIFKNVSKLNDHYFSNYTRFSEILIDTKNYEVLKYLVKKDLVPIKQKYYNDSILCTFILEFYKLIRNKRNIDILKEKENKTEIFKIFELINLFQKKGFKLTSSELKRFLYKIKNKKAMKIILINILIKEDNFFEIINDKTLFNKCYSGKIYKNGGIIDIFKYSNIIDYCLNSYENVYKIDFLIVLFKNMFKLESSNEKVKEILNNLRRVILLNNQFIKNRILESSPYWIKFLIKSEKGSYISIVNYLDLIIETTSLLNVIILRDLLKNNGFK